jgi:ATP adenylyltransferase/5',5'''-P-1,P-4-tetraphosphate phosphorylase II
VALSGTQIVAGSKTFTGLVNAVTPPVVDNSTLVATTEFVKQQYYLTRESVVDGGLVVGAGTTTANILSTEDNLALYTENYAVLTV